MGHIVYVPNSTDFSFGNFCWRASVCLKCGSLSVHCDVPRRLSKIIQPVNEFHFKWCTPVSYLFQNTTLHVGTREATAQQSFKYKSFFFFKLLWNLTKCTHTHTHTHTHTQNLFYWLMKVTAFTYCMIFFASVIY